MENEDSVGVLVLELKLEADTLSEGFESETFSLESPVTSIGIIFDWLSLPSFFTDDSLFHES